MRLLPSGPLRIKLIAVLWITIVWTIVGALDTLNMHAGSFNDHLIKTPEYDIWKYLRINITTSFFSGIISGTILVFYLREQLRNKAFGFSLLINSLAISIINFVIGAFIFDILFHMDFDMSPYSSGELKAKELLRSVFYYKKLIFWSIIVVLTIITLHVNDKYGYGILIKLLLGRYHTPKEEERIFMFVDIKSSTAIAEQLGHIRFFELLNDFFTDITNPILYTRGEIYQYVGDEVVISWTMKNGIRNANCIRCFYGMQEAIRKYGDRYREKYGLLPEFKAGLHSGIVTTGEIGIIKKDIVFSGDVMNTASRIQSMCNTYRVKILLSKYLLDKLHLPPHDFQPQRVGIIGLKGKRERVELYTFEESTIAAEHEPLLTSK